MDKMNGLSQNVVSENIARIKEMFPNVFTEGKIDFDALRVALGDELEASKERYQFTWNGKSESIKIAQSPSSGTLRPCKEKSKDWDNTENLYIEGDNLEALKQLQKTFYGQIKMVYIDPPYNTGNDFVYKDDFTDSLDAYKAQTQQTQASNPESNGRYHSDWLNLMYPRLILARNLLRSDGAIFISIDDNEVHNLRKLCDEVFGEKNFMACIVVENDARVRSYDSLAITHEYILFYRKSESYKSNTLVDFNKQFKYYDEYGGFDLYELRNRNSDFNIDNRPNLYYPFWVNPHSHDSNGLFELSLEEKEGWIKVYPQESQGIKTVWRWGKEKAAENINTVLFGKKSTGGWQIVKKYREATYSLKSVWQGSEFLSDRGTSDFKKLFNNKRVFGFPKSIDLIKQCLCLCTSNNDIVLDFFSGSATTAHAVMQLNVEDNMNRKFIMVQLPEITGEKSEARKNGYKNICEIGEERIRRAGELIKKEWEDKSSALPLISTDNSFRWDIGFKVFKLDSTNINPWDNTNEYDENTIYNSAMVFKSDRSKEDILYEIMLKYGVFDQPISEVNVNGKNLYRVGQRHMIICLEDNIDISDIAEICKLSPRVVVFKEDGFIDDNAKINAEYNLKNAGVEDVKCI